jgi:iron complex outermembrane recepter protein
LYFAPALVAPYSFIKSLFAALLVLLLPSFALAQKDTAITDSLHAIDEVVVTGIVPNSPKYTSLNIEPYPLALMNEKNPFNLSDALSKIPGISQMSTGNSISKPVIRGLYGNRILVLLSGVRFDNQQWQDEHGLGLSQIGIDRVEVIKGPASLLYGSEAMGGVINIIEEKPTQIGTKADAGTVLYSNSRGMLTDAGISSRSAKNRWWRLRLGAENHADYSDGANTRVLNSRNRGYYLKAGYGFERKNWVQENSYNFSYNQYGFILEDLPTFFDADKRWNRAMAGPHHNVMLNLFNSQNTIYLPKSVLKLNGGIQSNRRMEDEGGGQISLDMHLLSLLQNLRWEKKLNTRTTVIVNQQYTYTNNKNYGGRVIIPNASMMEGNLSGFFRFRLHKVIIETGAGGNFKYIHTLRTQILNAPGERMQPFTRNKASGNAMFGAAYNPNNKLTLKANIATGFRAPNLAELSSNGLHEGVYRYEIGDPNLKPEQNINTDINVEYQNKQLFFSSSVFYNRFVNYVYLSPTSETYFGFPVFRFLQQDATIFGGEFFASYTPKNLKWLQWKEGFTLTQGKLNNGGNLPFIPAYKLNSSVRFEKKQVATQKTAFVEPEFVYVFKQNRPAQFETNTGAYYLLNITSGLVIPAKSGNFKVGLTANNITSQVYADHLSRLKYFGLYNQGLNFVLSLRKEFK